MCIIVAKPMGVEMPDEETLMTCFFANPDGAGFMWADGKTVRIRKGFMEWEDFADALAEEIPESKRKELAIVMHFRIATHGKVQPMCCHPFPISSDEKELQALRIESRFGIAHNGVISGRITNDKRSDTMDFIARVVTPLMKMNPSFMRNDHALDLLEGACGSKLAIMDNSGDLVTVGEFIEDEGVLYSNTSYLTFTSRYSTYGSLFTGSEYESAYGSYHELVQSLPYHACELCDNAGNCVYWEPECTSARMAEEACAYYNDEVWEEDGEYLVSTHKEEAWTN